MNYPVWDVAFGAGLLIAVVAILHVFVSHFAVGGGLFPGRDGTQGPAQERRRAAQLAEGAHQVLCAGDGGLRRHQRGGHLVHYRVDQPHGHQQPDPHLCVGMGDRVGFLLRGDHRRAALPVWLGQAGGAAAPVVRLDLFHRRIPEPGDHQRDHHLHADLRELDQRTTSSGRAFSIPPTFRRWRFAPPLPWRWREFTR